MEDKREHHEKVKSGNVKLKLQAAIEETRTELQKPFRESLEYVRQLSMIMESEKNCNADDWCNLRLLATAHERLHLTPSFTSLLCHVSQGFIYNEERQNFEEYVSLEVWTSIETCMTSFCFYSDLVSVCITNKLQSLNCREAILAIGADKDIRDSNALVDFWIPFGNLINSLGQLDGLGDAPAEHAALVSKMVQDYETGSEKLPPAAASRGGNALQKGDVDICRAFLSKCKKHIAVLGERAVAPCAKRLEDALVPESLECEIAQDEKGSWLVQDPWLFSLDDIEALKQTYSNVARASLDRKEAFARCALAEWEVRHHACRLALGKVWSMIGAMQEPTEVAEVFAKVIAMRADFLDRKDHYSSYYYYLIIILLFTNYYHLIIFAARTTPSQANSFACSKTRCG